MFSLTAGWFELIVRAACIYIALLLMVRLSGKRTVGQFTPFDLLVMLLLSEGVSNALSGSEDSITGGLIIAAVLILLNYGTSFLTSRSRLAKQLLEGAPKILGRDGRLDPAALRREQVAEADVMKRLREEDIALTETREVLLETDGNISFVRRQQS
ncbi:MAG: DUF421 domain-containing protein [Lautropia sp.]